VDFQEVSYVKLSGDQRKKALEILGKGNVLLKKWSVYFPPKKYRQFRNAVMEGSKNPQYNGTKSIPDNKLKEFHADLPFMTAIREKYDDLDGRSVEQAIFESFSALAKLHASKWSLENDPVGLTKQDFLQEAYLQVIEAMYSWLPEKGVDISTFIWVSLKNRMSNVVNQGNMFCPLTNSDLELINRFEKTKKGMPESFTFEQVVDELGLSSDDGKRLNLLLSNIVFEGQHNMFTENVVDQRYDYTSYRKDIDRENSETNNLIEQDYVLNVLNNANLNKIERKIIEAAMNPFPGWQTEFARKNISPSTNKPYSRMRVNQILKNAREKVANILNQQKVAA
jgi:DNA-directed RNA polymerase specialized sigma subunit